MQGNSLEEGKHLTLHASHNFAMWYDYMTGIKCLIMSLKRLCSKAMIPKMNPEMTLFQETMDPSVQTQHVTCDCSTSCCLAVDYKCIFWPAWWEGTGMQKHLQLNVYSTFMFDFFVALFCAIGVALKDNLPVGNPQGCVISSKSTFPRPTLWIMMTWMNDNLIHAHTRNLFFLLFFFLLFYDCIK